MHNSKTYNVNKINDNDFAINGKGNNKIWDKALSNNNFDYHWKEHQPLKTEFKALYSNTHLYFYYRVLDNKIHIDNNENLVDGVNNSDRVEIFFRTDKNLNPYYCLEIDPSPRAMVFKALPNKIFDFNWKWPLDGLKIMSSITEKEYVVEGSISLESLKSLDLIRGNIIETGLYRAKFEKNNTEEYEAKWISWINPNTPSPDFHIHTSFGELHLLD